MMVGQGNQYLGSRREQAQQPGAMAIPERWQLEHFEADKTGMSASFPKAVRPAQRRARGKVGRANALPLAGQGLPEL